MRRKHVYGPVNSRRFGRSLGIDLVPYKVCSYDCTYCQLGHTTDLAGETRGFAPAAEILADLETALAEGAAPDVITLAGSGEPTLYQGLGVVVAGVKTLTDVPLLLLTNGSLLWDPIVREAVMGVDLLAPSLDAPDEATWRRINQPPADHGFDRMVEGIRETARLHPGQVRLEVMLLKGVNDSQAHLEAFAAILATIPCDGVDINSPVRPVPEDDVFPCDRATMEKARKMFGEGAEIIAKRLAPAAPQSNRGATLEMVLDSLGRRPQTAADLAVALRVAPNEVVKILYDALEDGKIVGERRGGENFFKPI